jgi:hypothetical protein
MSKRMKVATFNANSIRSRVDPILAWLQREKPDVLCLQETKVQDQDFPAEPIQALGYRVVFRGQKAYAGVAIVSKEEPMDVSCGLDDIDTQIKDLAKRARAGKITVDEVTGGTFTITNLGMFGIPQFRAIINPPEAAILAVGSIVKRPVVIDDGIHIRPIMVLTCSADHRILDGVSVAKFLQDLKTALETIS